VLLAVRCYVLPRLSLDPLPLLQACLELWTALQRKWIGLEPIFTAPDIMRQLPGETKAFRGVDVAWRDVMRR
jgi:dynein heavy chain